MLELSEQVVIWEKIPLLLSSPLHAGFHLLKHFEKGLSKAGPVELCIHLTIKHS